MDKQIDDIKLLSISEAAKLLNIGRVTLRKLINSGRIKCIQINKRIKIAYKELKRFVDESSYTNSNITAELFDYSQSNIMPVLEYDTTTIFENLLEEYIHGECLHKGQ